MHKDYMSSNVGTSVGLTKPYFPMLLGNGEEHVLIGYSGTMGACAGHEQWDYNGVSTGWFRPDTRKKPSIGVLNLLQCGYFVLHEYHAIGIETSEQSFNPTSGTLTTKCILSGVGTLTINTFLSSKHLLVHHFSADFNNDEMMLQFFVKSAPGPLNLQINDTKEVKNCLDFQVSGDDWNTTMGRLYCDQSNTRTAKCYNNHIGLEVAIKRNTEFTFAVKCLDNNPLLAPKTFPKIKDSISHQVENDNNAREWGKYSESSALELSYNNIADIYSTALYVIRAHQHPQLGGITIGAYPGMWGNTVYSWDMAFDMMALLGSNKIAEAKSALSFWKTILPNLAKRNAEAGLPGVSAPGDISISGLVQPSSREAILEQRHAMTADISILVWQYYLYTGDVTILDEYWDCLIQPLEFILGSCIEEFDTHAEIIRSPGTNGKERIDGKVVYFPNPTISLVSTIDALKGACEAPDLLNKEINSHWRELLPKLERGIEVNRHDGIVLASKDKRSAITKTVHEVALFGSNMDANSIKAGLQSYTSSEGQLRWTDHGYRAQPWINTYSGAALTRLGLEGAALHIEKAVALTTTLGGFPEAIRPDGVYYKTWYPTVHASFVHCLNLLLVNRKGDIVELFKGVPAYWGNISFKNLRIPLGLLISAQRTGSNIEAVITNDSKVSQKILIRSSGISNREKEIKIGSGDVIKISQRL